MKLKFMQNSSGTAKIGGKMMKVVTTMSRVDIYNGGKLVGSTSVKNPKDFDYYALLSFAKHKSGSSIQVA